MVGGEEERGGLQIGVDPIQEIPAMHLDEMEAVPKTERARMGELELTYAARTFTHNVGKIVEMATTEELLWNPKHPYSEALISAVPPADPSIKVDRIILQGDVPIPANPPSGCVFHPRCRYAKDVCIQEEPALTEVTPGHFASCHFTSELKRKGVEG